MAAWTCACGSQPPLSAANQNPGSCLDADVHHRLHSSAPAQEQHQLICRSPLQLSHSGDRGITYHSPARNLSRLPAQDSSRQSSPTAVLRPPSDHPLLTRHALSLTFCNQRAFPPELWHFLPRTNLLRPLHTPYSTITNPGYFPHRKLKLSSQPWPVSVVPLREAVCRSYANRTQL